MEANDQDEIDADFLAEVKKYGILESITVSPPLTDVA